MAWFAIQSLQEICVRKLVFVYPDFKNEYNILSDKIKERILTLLLKRSKIEPDIIAKLLNIGFRRLDLSCVDINHKVFQKMSRCKFLTFLNLNGDLRYRTDVTDKGMILIAKRCPNIKNLQLRNCLKITDSSVIVMAKNWARLENINLYGCNQITDVSLKAIGTYSKNLLGLNLVRTSITDKGINYLTESNCAKTLKEIQLDGCKYVSNKSIEQLSVCCPKLYLFTFSNCSNAVNWISMSKVSADVMFFSVP